MTLPTNPIVLDAAVVAITPRELRRWLPDLIEGGVDAIMVTVGVLEGSRETVKEIASWLVEIGSGKYPVRYATSVADFRAAKRGGQVAIGFSFQGGQPIEDSLKLLDVYARLGVRVMQLTYNHGNLIGDGCFEERDAGLTAFGRKVVKRLEELRIAIDISHVGVRTSLDAIELATGPVIASHGNARALCDTPRNLTDEQIRGVAASGGMIGLCAFPAFVTRSGTATLDQMIDHADYIRDLVGVEHIGIGCDFAIENEEDYVYYGYDPRYIPMPPWTFPTGIECFFKDFRNIPERLSARGYSDAEVHGIMGENFLSVFERIWGS